MDEIRRLAVDGGGETIANIRPDGFTLAATLELACTRVALKFRGAGEGVVAIDRWRAASATLDMAVRVLDGAHPPRVKPLSAPDVELFAGRHVGDEDQTPWRLFLDRFRRSLVNCGFAPDLAMALSGGALHEMADNIVQHSGEDPEHAAPGVVGYHVRNRWMSFAVVDVGRGVLASLRSNPPWQHLQSSMQALDAAVYQHATRRAEWRSGNGFQAVLKSLAELNGTLRFRSGDAALLLNGRGAALRVVTEKNEPMPGFQLSVTCSLDASSHQWAAVDPHFLT